MLQNTTLLSIHDTSKLRKNVNFVTKLPRSKVVTHNVRHSAGYSVRPLRPRGVPVSDDRRLSKVADELWPTNFFLSRDYSTLTINVN